MLRISLRLRTVMRTAMGTQMQTPGLSSPRRKTRRGRKSCRPGARDQARAAVARLDLQQAEAPATSDHVTSVTPGPANRGDIAGDGPAGDKFEPWVNPGSCNQSWPALRGLRSKGSKPQNVDSGIESTVMEDGTSETAALGTPAVGTPTVGTPAVAVAV